MADLLQTAVTWLEKQRTAWMTQSVTYRRGGKSVAVSATIGRTLFNLDDGAGAVLQVEARDYLILASDLVLDGSVIEPQRGDVIEETAGAKTYRYEVLGPGDEPCWRWSDPYRQSRRIHTKQVEET